MMIAEEVVVAAQRLAVETKKEVELEEKRLRKKVARKNRK